jgi:DNA-binding MarR family transcriptional regulator
LDEDLERLEKKGLVKVRSEQTEYGKSKRIILTREGTKIADEIWNALPDPYKEIAIKVKERIHPLSPDRVRQLVHNEYPEYKNTYVENDIE